MSTESVQLDSNSPMEVPYKNRMLRVSKDQLGRGVLGDFLMPKITVSSLGNKKLLRPSFRARENLNSNQRSKKLSETKILLGKSDSSIEFLSLSSADQKPSLNNTPTIRLENLDLRAVSRLIKSLQKSSTSITATTSELSFNL